MATMMQFDEDSWGDTRRRLFPADGDTDQSTEMNGEPSALTGKKWGDQWSKLRSSPTTVSEYPVVEMGEDGAEVTLKVKSDTFSSPQKKGVGLACRDTLRTVRSSSLLDGDCTPTPPCLKAIDTKRNSKFSNVWCHRGEYEAEEEEYQMRIESSLADNPRYSNIGTCFDWQMWLLPRTEQEDVDVHLKEMRSKMRNRVLNLRARKDRVRQLKKDLSPFRKPSRQASQLVRSRSFSIEDHASAIVRNSKQQSYGHFSNALGLCVVPEARAVSESPAELRHKVLSNDDLCYDSDPEEFAKRRSPCRPVSRRMKQKFYPFPDTIRSDDALDEFAYQNAVQVFLNSTCTLVHHPTIMLSDGTLRPGCQVAVDAWLERGQCLAELIQPKWMWKTMPSRQNAGTIQHMTEVECLDLFEITRVLEMDIVDRELFPFAKAGRCFLLQNIEGEAFCFEAKSLEERNRIVYSIKLVIARFGAMMLAGDENVYDEFFTTEVPSERLSVLDVLDDSDDDYSIDSYEA
eukprot:Nitzschia sp. Nitz4//scaffold1_size375055//260684//262228//NITZ4_000302-RA/size375055-processed-gene-0.451-mRNA-1//-1//CDS//3329541123//6590//frame0